MVYFSTLLLALFITISVMPLAKALAFRIGAMDVPGGRKVHVRPTPRCGGMAMALGTLLPMAVWTPAESPFLKALFPALAILVFFALLDDVKNLSYRFKFVGQVCAGLVVIFLGRIQIRSLGSLLPEGVFLPLWVSVPLTLVVLVGVTNAVNLADGLDGLAGGITLLSFVCIAFLAYQSGSIVIAALATAAVGAVFGFLRFNSYPAILFMGDVGSQFLGFLAVTLAVALTQGNTPLCRTLPLLLVGLPVLDTFWVMWERVRNGGSPFQADKRHLHHKLMRLGFRQTEAVFSIYVLQAAMVSLAFVFRFHSEWTVFVLYLALCTGVVMAMNTACKSGWRLPRYNFIEAGLKGWIRIWRTRAAAIRISFGIVKTGVPILILVSCLLPSDVPQPLSGGALAAAILVAATWFAGEAWMRWGLRVALYLLIPVALYLGTEAPVPWIPPWMLGLYNLCFPAMVLFSILTLKLTRRTQGFAVSPLDFLILFIAVGLPLFPGTFLQSPRAGFLAARIIVLFFSYEVLMGELRGDMRWPGGTTVVALALLGVKGLY